MMNKWSIRRRRIILIIVLTFLALIIGIPLYFFLQKPPTCFDNKLNGDETGVDCGGSCELICSVDALAIQSKGDARVLKVATSTYELVVSVENPNPSAKILKAGYSFKVYSQSSTGPIKVVKGFTYIPKASSFAIFEGPINFGESLPSRAVFEWDKNSMVWLKDISPEPDLKVEESTLVDEQTSPKLEATVKNLSLERVQNIELVALVYDSKDNIVGASKTFVDAIEPNESSPIVFTWTQPFTSTSTRSFIFTRIFPDSSYIK